MSEDASWFINDRYSDNNDEPLSQGAHLLPEQVIADEQNLSQRQNLAAWQLRDHDVSHGLTERPPTVNYSWTRMLSTEVSGVTYSGHSTPSLDTRPARRLAVYDAQQTSIAAWRAGEPHQLTEAQLSFIAGDDPPALVHATRRQEEISETVALMLLANLRDPLLPATRQLIVRLATTNERVRNRLAVYDYQRRLELSQQAEEDVLHMMNDRPIPALHAFAREMSEPPFPPLVAVNEDARQSTFEPRNTITREMFDNMGATIAPSTRPGQWTTSTRSQQLKQLFKDSQKPEPIDDKVPERVVLCRMIRQCSARDSDDDDNDNDDIYRLREELCKMLLDHDECASKYLMAAHGFDTYETIVLRDEDGNVVVDDEDVAVELYKDSPPCLVELDRKIAQALSCRLVHGRAENDMHMLRACTHCIYAEVSRIGGRSEMTCQLCKWPHYRTALSPPSSPPPPSSGIHVGHSRWASEREMRDELAFVGLLPSEELAAVVPNIRTSRGVGADIMVLDEAAYTPTSGPNVMLPGTARTYTREGEEGRFIDLSGEWNTVVDDEGRIIGDFNDARLNAIPAPPPIWQFPPHIRARLQEYQSSRNGTRTVMEYDLVD